MIGHPRARVRAAREHVEVQSLERRLRKMEPLSPGRRNAGDDTPETIVSPMSFGERVATVDLAIRSILASTPVAWAPGRRVHPLCGGGSR